MGRPIFVPHTLFDMRQFTLMRNLMHAGSLEKCVRGVWGMGFKHRMSFSLSSSQTLALSSLQITQDTKTYIYADI